MTNAAWQQMTRLAAIVAVALLCPQTLVITHDHESLDDALCAVCGTTSVAAAADATHAAADHRFRSPEPDTLPARIVQPRHSTQHLSRAPPAA